MSYNRMYELPLFIFNHGFKFQDYVCNVCHDLSVFCLNINDIAFITVKNVDYRCIIHNISKADVINLLKSAVLEDRGYIWKNIVLIFNQFNAVFLTFFLVQIKWLIVCTT